MSKTLALRRAVMSIPLARPSLRRVSKTQSSLLVIIALVLCLAITGSAPARASIGGNVLIVAGTTSLAQTSANVLNPELTNLGFTVTIVNSGVPGSLAGYQQIYDLRYDNSPPFTNAEMTQYLAFLNAAPGNALFLMGENVGFNARNTPINQFIALAGGGTIPSPATTSAASETVNAPFTGPNAISTVKFAACGLVTFAGTGRFASSEATGGCSLFFGQSSLANALTGALVVVYDVNFIGSAPVPGAVNEIAFRQNLEQFVAAPPVIPPTLAPPAQSIAQTAPALGTWGMILLAGALLAVARRAFVRGDASSRRTVA